MKELDKARLIEAPGGIREKAATRFKTQIAEWGIALPRTEPLVLDFGLGHFGSGGIVECWITNEVEAGYCGKYIFVSDGQACPMHHHRQKHESFFVVRGRLEVVHEGRTLELKAGDTLAVPPGTKHSFAGIGPALLLELSQPCLIEDNYFQDSTISIGGNYPHKG